MQRAVQTLTSMQLMNTCKIPSDDLVTSNCHVFCNTFMAATHYITTTSFGHVIKAGKTVRTSFYRPCDTLNHVLWLLCNKMKRSKFTYHILLGWLSLPLNVCLFSFLKTVAHNAKHFIFGKSNTPLKTCILKTWLTLSNKLSHRAHYGMLKSSDIPIWRSLLYKY